MLREALFNRTPNPVVKKSLDASMLRSRVIANNIANVTTPGYRRVEVSFEDELRNALSSTRLKGSQTNNNHMRLGRSGVGDVNARAYKPNDPTLPSGVNNVDIDMEMAKLAETQIMFNYGLRFNQGTYRKLNASIQGRALPL
ncbi:flagellar basal body rod protein FlgB [Chitinispirillales bacterium ANBcel5]|uniref:flagellar basal body rod protein FlgB n=1 Tax=Cellulosispirillum alkaliphilum TaxID=3039283 RepID=UPI002A5488A5|nr:flagellar basal body rod protein FlgB [Chitinispirillales bacterium ANBcel5]